MDLQGERAAQRADIEAMEALAEALGDVRRRAHAAWRRSALSLRIADWTAMEAATRQAVVSASQAGGAELRLVAQRMVASALGYQGDLAAGQVLAQETLAEARALGLRRAEGLCLNLLGVIASRQGDDVAKLDLLQQSLAADQAEGNRRAEAIARGNVGVGWLDLGELTQARRALEEGLRLIRANGDRALECSPLCNLSTLALRQGDDARALALARTALETAVVVQARNWQAIALCRLGDAELALGRHAAAAEAYGQARERATEIDDPLQHDASSGLARVALAQGDNAAALHAIAPLLALDARTGADSGLLDGAEYPRLIELTCHQVLVRAGGPGAADWLRRAHERLQANAARITDAHLRQSFLHNIPHHREIVAAWTRAEAMPLEQPLMAGS